MARSRILKPGFFQNDQLAELSCAGRLLFAGLWTLADREGRLIDNGKRIKAALFPWDGDVKVDDLLAGLAERGFITRYQIEAVAVIQVINFRKHQNPHTREAESELPENPNEKLKPRNYEAGRVKASTSRAVSTSTSDSVSTSDDAEASSAPDEPVLVFPCVGAVPAFSLSERQVREWASLYPNLDVLAECRKALAWILANPGHRKTAKGVPRFLQGWLSRAVDRRVGVDRREATRRGPRTEPAVVPAWTCAHKPECTGRWECQRKTDIAAFKEAEKVSA